MNSPKLIGYDSVKTTGKQLNQLHTLFLAYNNDCNLACPFCFSGGGQRTRSSFTRTQTLLSEDELRNIIDDALGLGTKSVVFFGEGEPLLNKQLFFKLAERVSEKNAVPVLFTNGTLIDKTTAKKLFELNVSVVGKLYSFNPEINEQLTGNKNLYEYVEMDSKKVPSHIKHLLDAGFANTNRFALNTVVTRYNKNELLDIWAWARTNGIIPYMDFLNGPSDFDVSREERANLKRRVWELDKELGFDYAFSLTPHLGDRTCDLSSTIIIGAYGEMRACPSEYTSYGNVRETPIAQLWDKRKSLNVCTGACPNSPYCHGYIRKSRHVRKSQEREKMFPSKAKKLFETQPLIAFSTVSFDRKPNTIAVFWKKIVSNDTILILDNFMVQTKENLEVNPNVCLSFWDAETEEGYKLKGEASYHVDDEVFEQGKTWMQSKQPDKAPRGVVQIRVTEAYDLTPGKGAGKRIH